jgi:NADH:ubiquinone oxidoreductase subunit E
MTQNGPKNLSAIKTYLDTVSHRGRTMLLPALHKAQELYGWIHREVQEEISRSLRVPLADIHGVIEFYTMFYNNTTAKKVVRVCEDPACHLAGAEEIIKEIEKTLGVQYGETTADGHVTFEHVPCLGMCELAPAALNGDKPAGELTPSDVQAFLERDYPEPNAKIFGDPLWITGRIGKVDPSSLED